MSTPESVESEAVDAVQPKGLKHLREYIPIKLIAVVLVIFGLVKGYQWIQHSGDTTINAYFANADGLYQGDDVKVLGVSVGKVTDIHPEASDVRVTLRVDSGVKIPTDTKAAIVSPSLVSGRYVQLSPYTTGGVLGTGASIPTSRTAVPLSFDDVKSQLTQLSSSLAPQGSDSQPLRDTINGLQASLRSGNAGALRTAIQGLQSTATTLSDGRGDLFSTIANLNSFTQNLAINDAAVAGFTRELSSVSGVLAANRRQLTAAVATLGQALGSAGNFLKTNRSRINASIKDLNLLGATLADRSNQLAGVLHVAPTAVIDLYNII
ncbi:MAG TPA: MCE family protein, partial [Marmoricola sp.]|nr:MCE family protein [Marmoricola sp.]